MTKIHITGNAGSGKSTLAERIARTIDLPVDGLDNVVWQPEWKKTPSEERLLLEKDLVSRSNWIIEGVSETVRQAADVVILLDVSRTVAFYRCAKRNWRYLFRSRPGLPHNCPEVSIVPYLIRLIWNFPIYVQPRILSEMLVTDTVFYHVKSANDLQMALDEIGVNSIPDVSFSVRRLFKMFS